MSEIKKAIIPAAGLGTRFLPATKCLPKEMLPLVDKPMVSYTAKEAKDSGIERIMLVLSAEKKIIADYFKQKPKLESVLQERNHEQRLEKLKKEQDCFEGVSFASVLQLKPKGDGDAVLKAKVQVGQEPFAVMFPDDIFYSKIPALSQLIKVFGTSEKPVVGLKKIPSDKLSSYGVVQVEPIAKRLYRIKAIVEKPEKGKEPSGLAICGRYVLPAEAFDYLAKIKPNKKGEIILAEALKAMLEDGKMVYGCEIEGDWLECGKTEDWLKSTFYLGLKHKDYGPILRQWMKDNK